MAWAQNIDCASSSAMPNTKDSSAPIRDLIVHDIASDAEEARAGTQFITLLAE